MVYLFGMDLFSANHRVDNKAKKPLAERIRPKSFKELYLSSDAEQKLSFLKHDDLVGISFVLFGPPGVGKTSIMKVVEAKTAALSRHVWLNAVDISVKELRQFCSEAKEIFLIQSKKTILFIDEIHRLSKAQQDVLLPSIESGEVVLVGATTENPKSALNRPLVSRCRVIKLSSVGLLGMRALSNKVAFELGFKSIDEFIDKDALEALINYALGDGRKLIGLLESLHVQKESFPLKVNDLSLISIDERSVPLSSAQFQVENTSALIKSMRSSDLEASMLYLIRLVEGGVDPVYIYRRLLVFTSEDVGNADPQALILVQSSKAIFEAVGMPEGYYGLVQMVEYLAKAPKSRKVVAFLKKTKEVSWSSVKDSPPAHLQIRGSGAKTGQNLPKSNIYGFLEED